MAIQMTGGSRSRAHAASALGVLLLLTAQTALANWQNSRYSDWRSGRATRYGGLDDYWTIHDGHCWHKYLSPNVKTGWDIAATSDLLSEWGKDGFGMCGMCLEVKCKNMGFKDGYGNWLDRGSACHDSSASLIVQITDICPCQYPSNAYSNKRWCCGDMPHLDLSTFAFEKLAEKKWGVIGIEYRFVPCGAKPNKVAKLPNGQSPSPGQAPPKGFKDSDDPRPWPN